MFDVNQLLDTQTTEEAKRRPPLRTDIEYIGILGEPKVRQNAGKKDPSKVYSFLDWDVEVDVSAVPGEAERLGTSSVRLRHSVSLDLTESNSLDWSTGKNVGLGIMREALGMNVKGQAFNIRQMQGRPVRLRISHEEYPEGSGVLQDRIKSVAKV